MKPIGKKRERSFKNRIEAKSFRRYLGYNGDDDNNSDDDDDGNDDDVEYNGSRSKCGP